MYAYALTPTLIANKNIRYRILDPKPNPFIDNPWQRGKHARTIHLTKKNRKKVHSPLNFSAPSRMGRRGGRVMCYHT